MHTFFVKIVELGVKKLKLLDDISKLKDNAANTRIAHQIDVHANQLQINSLISAVNLINIRIRLLLYQQQQDYRIGTSSSSNKAIRIKDKNILLLIFRFKI